MRGTFAGGAPAFVVDLGSGHVPVAEQLFDLHDVHAGVESLKNAGKGMLPLFLQADLDAIVNSLDKILLGAEISLRGLDTRVAEQQLDLFEFPARLPA